MFSSYLSVLLHWTECIWKFPPEKRKNVLEVLQKTWYYGITCFGGPPVHFRTFHKAFVEKHGWVDDQLFQELFALFQSLPGSASTKMIFSINWIHAGFRAGCLSFIMWCSPGAVGMYCLALGISQVGDTLPNPVYALLSGLNSATVGVIALAAVHLSSYAITDRLTRLLVFFGGVAGMLYTALWYFPVLMVVAGLSTLIWDTCWLQKHCMSLKSRLSRKQKVPDPESGSVVELVRQETIETVVSADDKASTRSTDDKASAKTADDNKTPKSSVIPERQQEDTTEIKLLSWRKGMLISVTFLFSAVAIIILRSALYHKSRGLSLFANFYLAGTIIFGGGPVVIPLLREYIVAEGWVSPRDFLMGLAIIQAFPGPNFNFAVYLGALSVANTSIPSYVGALIGFVGMFLPGMWLAVGSMGIWARLRNNKTLKSLLRGINAAAVGLIYTAVYRLWHVGLLNAKNQRGTSLSNDPWWVAVTAAAFVGGKWFKLPAPLAILAGGLLGLFWYGVTQT